LAKQAAFLLTFADLAGMCTPGYVNERSLQPLFQGSATTLTSWRQVLVP
jgi:hypothetical protein